MYVKYFIYFFRSKMKSQATGFTLVLSQLPTILVNI